MKNKIKQMSKLILAILFTFNTFIIGMGESLAAGMSNVKITERSSEIPYSGSSTKYGTWDTNVYTRTFKLSGNYDNVGFDQKSGLCITPEYNDPPTNVVGTTQEITNDTLKKIILYGKNGLNYKLGMEKFAATHGLAGDDLGQLLVTHVAAGIAFKEEANGYNQFIQVGWPAANPTVGASQDLIADARAFISYVKDTANNLTLDDRIKFYIFFKHDETNTQAIAFYVLLGSLKIQKTANNTDLLNNASNYSLEGAEYTVYNDGACTNSAGVEKLITKADGSSNTIHIYAGEDADHAKTFYVKETKPPKGFALNGECKPVTVKPAPYGTTVVNVTDDIKTGSVKLKKESFDPKFTNEHSDVYSLEGAQFTIYNSSSLKDANKVGVLTTDKDGNSNTLNNLPYGTYYAVETKAPKGFKALEEPLQVTIDESHPNGVFKAVDFLGNGILKIIKHSTTPTDRDLTGATFKVYESDCKTEVKNVPELVTDAKGDTQEVEIAAGKYCVRETKAPEGFTVNEEPVEILVLSTGEATVIDMYDDLIPENPKTGVATYFGITMLAVAGSVYGLKVLKKKRVFKKL